MIPPKKKVYKFYSKHFEVNDSQYNNRIFNHLACCMKRDAK